MRRLLVFPVVLALVMAEEHYMSGQRNHQRSQFSMDTRRPANEEEFEERLLVEMKNNKKHQTHHKTQPQKPHPHLIHQIILSEYYRERLYPKRPTTTTEAPQKIYNEEVSLHHPVPDPHVVEEETEIPHLSTLIEDTYEKSSSSSSSMDIHHHNKVEDIPFKKEEIEPKGLDHIFKGTESTLNQDLFEHHPNTGIPELEPTVGTESGAALEVVQEPVVLPVTEGKDRGQETINIPKNLMPIHPGGGSKFEDLEKEKLENKKMSQTKDTEVDTENGASHEAEGLYSSAATLCLSSIIFSLSSSFRLIV